MRRRRRRAGDPGRRRTLAGVEAVVDKDLVAALLAIELKADALLLLTDVPAVEANWGTPAARPLRDATLEGLRSLGLAAGSMGPKVEAASRFAEATGGRAVIGALEDASALLAGTTGTTVRSRAPGRARLTGDRVGIDPHRSTDTRREFLPMPLPPRVGTIEARRNEEEMP